MTGLENKEKEYVPITIVDREKATPPPAVG
jgi:hypothetical protein